MSQRKKDYYGTSRKTPLGGILAAVLAVAIAGGAITGWLLLKERRPALDATTLCPKNGPAARTVLLLDMSDALTARQQAALDQLLRDLKDPKTSRASMNAAGVSGGVRYVEPHQELVAYDLKDNDHDLSAFIRICNPGNPNEGDLVDEMTTGRSALRRWQNFNDQIAQQFEQKRTGPELETSPILEALALIVQREAGSISARLAEKATPLRIIIFSDMIQNSAALSHFNQLPDWSRLEASPAYASISSDLKSIEVVIYYLRRSKYAAVQSERHYTWWREVIARLGGRLIYMEPI
jgi:hypothetical protein